MSKQEKDESLVKEVTIRRRPNNTNLPDELWEMGKWKISSTWVRETRDIKRGLDNKMQAKLLPSIIGVSEGDPKFSEETRKYYANLSVVVPPGSGVTFNIAIGKDGIPVQPKDYVLYYFCIADHCCAPDRESMEKNTLYKFWVDDPDREKKRQITELEKRKKAQTEYLKIAGNEHLMDWLIVMMGTALHDRVSIPELSIEDKDLILDRFTREAPELFTRLAKDEDLQIKAMIETAVSKGYFERTENIYYYGDIKLGNGLEESVRYLRDPVNSKIYVSVKHAMSDLGFAIDSVEQSQAAFKAKLEVE